MVAKKYLSKKENPKQWTKQSAKYKERIVNKIHKIPLLPSPPVHAAVNVSPVSLTSADNTSIQQLSLALKETELSEELFGGMWIKAAKLAKDSSAITNAPGLSTSTSFTDPRKRYIFLKLHAIVLIMVQKVYVHMC